LLKRNRIFNLRLVYFICLIFFIQYKGLAHALDLRGFVEAEARIFFNPAINPGQEDHTFSGVLSPELNHRFDNGLQVYFIPFYRIDHADDERTHFDLRELDFIYSQETWDLRFGVRKVFWGVTETQHLVDIINQTDLLESPDGEEKLGQPMVNLALIRDWGTVDFFVMPYFRERTFPGRGGRLRLPILVDDDQTRFDSDAEEWHPDFAGRYFHTVGNWDIGLSHFYGTNREPTFQIGFTGDGEPVLVPLYEQIHQSGMDLLYVYDSWIWKLEAIYRQGMRPKDYFASTFGFEYTFSGIWETGMDLGVLSEWMYDERKDKATNPLQNDITLGMRLGVNDINGTEVLIALVQDLESSTKSFFIEASSRLNEHWRITVEARALMDQPLDDPLFTLRDDDFVQISLAYHF
jgi:hypothetical protein